MEEEGDPPLVQPRLVLVAADAALVEPLIRDLSSSGFRVWHALTPPTAVKLVDQYQPRAVIVDLASPEAEALMMCAEMRAMTSAPLLLCSSLPHQWARVGLALGADDFVAKPVRFAELEARLSRLLSRGQLSAAGRGSSRLAVLRVGDLVMVPAQHRAGLSAGPLQLTPTEYRLLLALATNAGMTLLSEDLARLIWQCPAPGFERLLDVHIRRLRRKLATSTARISTVRGAGYCVSAVQPA